jgi:hypothetical protein
LFSCCPIIRTLSGLLISGFAEKNELAQVRMDSCPAIILSPYQAFAG